MSDGILSLQKVEMEFIFLKIIGKTFELQVELTKRMYQEA